MNFHFVYFAQSQGDFSVYVGYTINLKERMAQHNAGKTKSTKSKTPLTLIYFEAYTSKSDALKREKFIKNNYACKMEIISRFSDFKGFSPKG